jgi:hypothetical protein
VALRAEAVLARTPQKGHATPRLAPPLPAKSLLPEYTAAAKELGIELMPWQKIAARYMTARGPNPTHGPQGHWLYRRVAVIVARQNGKTELLLPRILLGLRLGRRMLHTAQDRARPAETFNKLADWFEDEPARKELYGVVAIRRANGQEVIKCKNGGRYTLVAPRTGGARGGSVDDIFLDEVREFPDFRIDGIIRPTITASKDPQIIYLSNAGDEFSLVLKDLRARRDSLPSLAYLEWSAAEGRTPDDREGWREANPALGHTIGWETIEDNYRSMEPPVFETEHLCRWVITMAPRLISDADWHLAHGTLETPLRPFMGISMDPSGTRASAALAWHQSDGTIGLKIIADVTGDPIDTTRLGVDLRLLASRLGVSTVVFDTLTDQELAKYFRKSEPLIGRAWANASERFFRVVKDRQLVWDEADAITGDLPWTSRKDVTEGAWIAVKAKEERPITASLAAIRAVWLTAGKRPIVAKVY